ncbi:hypothetical protein CDL12_13296 [Handroanthus impetiginosus]|uniref:Uncharacterized protein n=1 Tax=Handroanthus impetiginosus TaxID=429701 RepID=A0A2G9H972_9LAMI|nr:hypothetical protein CDL12_13296 [Handroanthus impetiginosus]
MVSSKFENYTLEETEGLVKSEAFDQNWNQLHCYRPEAMLGSSWLQQGASFSKQQGFEHDSNAAFLNDDLGSELNMSAGTCACSWGLSSCTWNNMPAVCQMSDHR